MSSVIVCPLSWTSFTISPEEITLLDKLSPIIGGEKFPLPLPTLAPELRERMRYMFRNTKTLFHAQDALTGEKTISRIAPEFGYTIYSNANRSSDKRDSTSYGIDYNTDVRWSIRRLVQTTPYQDLIGSLSNVANNSVYTNCTADVNNCYMVFDAHDVNNSCYVTRGSNSESLVDCYRCQKSQYCYECVTSQRLNNCCFCIDCDNSAHLYRCRGCIGCHDCIGCLGLENQSYHIMNKQYTKEEYISYVEKLRQSSFALPQDIADFIVSYERNTAPINCEQSQWESLVNCKHVTQSKDCLDAEDCMYCREMTEAQDCLDVTSYGHQSSLMYHSTQVGRYSNHIYASSTVGKSEYLFYCLEVKKSRYCFGCVNMRDAEYCIFNKQYSKEEWLTLVPKLIETMGMAWIRWAFFPPECSPYAYNDSDAEWFYPIRDVIAQDGAVLHHNAQGTGMIKLTTSEGNLLDGQLFFGTDQSISVKWRLGVNTVNIPANAQTRDRNIQLGRPSDDMVTKFVYLCRQTGKPYRITQLEYDFYTQMWLPLPQFHPDVRFDRRYAQLTAKVKL